MNSLELKELIYEDKVPDISKRFEIKASIDRYPYFQFGIFCYLKSLFVADDPLFRQELQRLSIFVTDKRALFYYVLANQYKHFFEKKSEIKEINKSRTDILLNAFFETVDDDTIDQQLSFISPNASDYFSNLKSADEYEISLSSNSEDIPLKHQSIIDKFIQNSDQRTALKLSTDIDDTFYKEPIKEEENSSEELQDDLFFTETLAGIYIKQHKYERAYEIIKRLSLNYPEKNIYFADQISFLEKLIINTKTKNNK